MDVIIVKKTRKIKTLNLVALIVAVLGLTVAFAALSKTLTINGSASVDAASWDIKFVELSEPIITGDASTTSTARISDSGVAIENIGVSLTKPGDSVEYTYKVRNNGTINAKLESILSNNMNITEMTEDNVMNYVRAMFPKCDWDGDGATTDEEPQKCRSNIGVTIGLVDAFNYPFPAKTTSPLYNLKIEYDSDATELPKGEVEVDLNVAFNFVQVD